MPISLQTLRFVGWTHTFRLPIPRGRYNVLCLYHYRHWDSLVGRILSVYPSLVGDIMYYAYIITDIEIRWLDAYFPFTHPCGRYNVLYLFHYRHWDSLGGHILTVYPSLVGDIMYFAYFITDIEIRWVDAYSPFIHEMYYAHFITDIEIHWVDAYFPFTHPSWEI